MSDISSSIDNTSRTNDSVRRRAYYLTDVTVATMMAMAVTMAGVTANGTCMTVVYL